MYYNTYYYNQMQIKNKNLYTLYILRCSDATLYTGITNNLEKRLKMHNGEIPWGARYTSGRRPVELVYQEELAGRSEASKREREVKKLGREEKERLCKKNKINLNKKYPPNGRKLVYGQCRYPASH